MTGTALSTFSVRRTDAEHGGEILRLKARIEALEGQLTKAGISPS